MTLAYAETETQQSARFTTVGEMMTEACRHHDTPTAAAKLARQWLRDDPILFESITEPLIWLALLRGAYWARSKQNARIKRSVQNGSEEAGPRQTYYDAALTTRAAHVENILELNVGGKILGNLTGSELRVCAEDCRGKGRRLTMLSMVLDKLAEMAGEDILRERVPEKMANKIWRDLCHGRD